MFMAESYDVSNSKRVPIIMNCLGCKGLFCTNTDEDQETCKNSVCLFNV